MRVWACMVYQKWAHTMINGCVQGSQEDPPVGEITMHPKPSHPNCGWFDMEKVDE